MKTQTILRTVVGIATITLSLWSQESLKALVQQTIVLPKIKQEIQKTDLNLSQFFASIKETSNFSDVNKSLVSDIPTKLVSADSNQSLEQNMTLKNLLTAFDSNSTKTPDLNSSLIALDLNDSNRTKAVSIPEVSLEHNKTLHSVKGDEISLTDAVKRSLEQNYLIKAGYDRIRQFEERSNEAYADHLPKLDYKSNFTKNYEYTRTAGKGANRNFIYNDAELKLTQNLYSGGGIQANVKKFDYLKDAEDFKTKQVIEEETLKIAKAYLDVLYARRAVEAHIENMSSLEEILRIVKLKYSSGAVSLAEESSIMASYTDANTSLIKAESAYVDARNYYEFVSNLSLQDAMPFEKFFEIKLDDFDTMSENLLKTNPELMSMQKSLESKQAEIRAAKADYLPRVNAVISGYSQDQDTEAPSASKADIFQKNAGYGKIEFLYNLYSGNATDAKVERLKREESELVNKIEYQKKKLMWDAQQLYNSVRTLDRTLANSETEYNAVSQMVETYWEKFRLGNQELDVLLIAQKQLNQNRQDRLKYLKNYMSDSFTLLAMNGELLKFFLNR